MKKRYQLTLTSDLVDEFQRLSREMGMPPGFLSSSIDEYLVQITDVLKTIVDKKKFTLKDMFQFMSDQLEDLDDDKKELVVISQKKNSKSKVK